MPHAHILVTLDWQKIEEKWQDKFGRPMTEEDYIEEFISAEIPDLPPADDNSAEANSHRRYHDYVINQTLHTCRVGRCKETAADPCDKGFPVFIISAKIFIQLCILAPVFFEYNCL